MKHLESISDGKRSEPTDIAQVMVDHFKIPANAKSVYDVLKISKDIHRDSKGYKLMKSGLDKLPSQENEEKSIVIEANRPFLAKSISLRDTFIVMKGPVLICDPYLDSSTLSFLYRNFSKETRINFLTQTIKDIPTGSILSQIEELKKEGYTIDIRVYSKSELHDRYVINSDNLWLSGNSFNGLGNKESFLTKAGLDIKESVMTTFNHRWKASKPLS